MKSRLGRRSLSSAAILAALVALTVPHAVSRTADSDLSRSLIGNYLSGRFARSLNDPDRAAAMYHDALTLDPANEVLLEQTFLMSLTVGDWPRAIRYAERMVAKEPTHRMANLILGLSEFKAGHLSKADAHFAAAGSGPIGELMSSLAHGWIKVAQGDVAGALEALSLPKQAEWAQFYVQYHRALIADVGGRSAEAQAAFERVFKQDNKTLRTALAYAQSLAHSGDPRLASSILREHLDRVGGEGHPLARALSERIRDGAKIDFLVPTARDGLAEVFYGLGEALTGEGGVNVGILYLQMALFLVPDQPFALAALANAYETTKRYDAAISAYDRIPKGSPLQASIDIRKAFDLNSLERVDEAKELLEKVAAADPKDVKPLDALGSIMRSHKRYAEAVEYYTKAIALIGKPERRHWTYYYSRGTCYERLKKWSLAEPDLQKALQLYPEQPLVLNYLGYSWVDQDRNLKLGMSLIEKAVSLKPDDGYIVDSLGWAHYRQGNYKEAVKYLERAVELRPDDPTLNDHLGDALWRVGREREARFQWDQSLTLNPEPDDADKIRRKLSKGLQLRSQARLVKRTRQAAHTDAPRKKVERASGTRPVVE